MLTIDYIELNAQTQARTSNQSHATQNQNASGDMCFSQEVDDIALAKQKFSATDIFCEAFFPFENSYKSFWTQRVKIKEKKIRIQARLPRTKLRRCRILSYYSLPET